MVAAGKRVRAPRSISSAGRARRATLGGATALAVGLGGAVALLPTAATAAVGSVALVGDLQSELGCPGDWQPECAATELAPTGTDGVFDVSLLPESVSLATPDGIRVELNHVPGKGHFGGEGRLAPGGPGPAGSYGQGGLGRG